MATPVERVLAKLPDAKRSGKGWSARCPAHDDRRASLSIAEGDDGRALLKCHASCNVSEICAAVGLRVSDLMPQVDTRRVNGVYVNDTRQKSSEKRVSSTVASNSARKAFAAPNDAVSELERRLGPRSDSWYYHDVEGRLVGVVVRWDLPNGKKDIRPVSRHDGEWRIGGMPDPRPLYELPGLAAAKRVYVCEGEKAADAIGSIGLVATTSAHGCDSPGKTDWSPLAGKEVVLLRDNDSPGRKYGNTVTALLAKLSPNPIVKMVELPDLPDHGDAADFVAARAGTDADELRRIVDTLADEAEQIQVEPAAAAVDQFVPFPVDALPEPVRGFVFAGAKAIGCDPSYVALPMLAQLSAAIGNTRRIQLKRGWTAPGTLWCAIIGESGTAKTPAFKLAMRAIRERQRRALDRHAEATREFEVQQMHYEKALAEWKREKKAAYDPPAKPEAPQAERFIVSDTTVEALAPLLLANQRGLLLARDELAGWIGSFDRYAGGNGADSAHWLSMHSGESICVDRKTGIPRTIYVPRTAVCICGGIQPAVLHRALGVQHRDSGLAARLLLTCPPRIAKRWTEADIDPVAEVEIARLIDRLFELQPSVGDDDELRPVVVSLSLDAKAEWKAYYDAHAQEQADLAGELAAAWSKLEEYAARLALVIHFARWAADDPTLASADVVDVASMSAGIQLATWFKGEARRVYAMLGESDDDRDRRRLVEWIDRRGGSATVREVQQGCRWLRDPGVADVALNELARTGWGRWQDATTTAKGGRPSRKFVLTPLPTVNETPEEPDENLGIVDVDGVDGSQANPDVAGSDDEWGEV